jgi:biopolymer transport protein ExbD
VNETTSSERVVALSDHPFSRDLACADLYRQASCATAWRDAVETLDVLRQDDVTTKIAVACAAAYCPHLTPQPALCSPGRLQQMGHEPLRIQELRALDTAILEYEGVIPATASSIAARVLVFGSSAHEERAAPRTPAADHEGPWTASLVLTIPADGDVDVGGKATADSDIDDLFRAAFARDQATQVIFKADKGVPHGRIVNLMERAKQAGLTHLAIGTTGN